jgi:hypothetical protein
LHWRISSLRDLGMSAFLLFDAPTAVASMSTAVIALMTSVKPSKLMNGWRSPHCDEAPDEYQLKQEAGPARYAPGAECSARAHATMNYLDSIGIKTSNDTIH